MPLLIVVSLIVKFKIGKPILFKQKRPGKNGEIFTMLKFRTMTNEKDENGELLEDSKRLTPLGTFLRKTSIDELPELINIFKGDMSFVGPRPLSVLYLPYYTKEEFQRHSVLPGLTGLAQIKGRNRLNWEEKFEYDLYYVENLSFKLDLILIVKTFITVLGSKNDIVTRGTGEVQDFHIYRKKNLEKGDSSERNR